jgi:hypothetical protein
MVVFCRAYDVQDHHGDARRHEGALPFDDEALSLDHRQRDDR